MIVTVIDESSNNPGFEGYDLTAVTFVFVKLTEGTGYRNPLAGAQIAWARAHGKGVGGYHWAVPWENWTQQAQFFIAEMKALGLSVYAIDEEDASQVAGDAQWGQCISAIDGICGAVFGDHGLNYVGQFFHPATLQPLARGKWWDPNYGPNDGQVHPLPPGVTPVLHQYTSIGGLDRSVVCDPARWAQITGTPHQEMANMFLYSNSHGTGFLVTDQGKSPLANNTDYVALRDKAGVRDAGKLDDHTDAGIPLAVKV